MAIEPGPSAGEMVAAEIEGTAQLNTGPADDQLLEVTPRAA
jgi:hypothetical protein